MIRILALIAGTLLLAGCAPTPEGPSPRSSGAETASSVPVPAPLPATMTIPRLEVRSDLVPLGLDERGTLQVPPVEQPMQAGYYAGPDPAFDGDEVLPGEVGPAVIAGHVDGVIDGRAGQPGIFHRLHELRPGDEVYVARDDGSTLRFLVDRLERYPKDAFPTSRVYGDTPGPELRLITCGGDFDHAADSYRDNWVVYAVLAEARP